MKTILVTSLWQVLVLTEDNLKHHVYNYCAIFSGKVDKTMQFVKSSGATVAFDEVHFKPETGISMLYQNTLKKCQKLVVLVLSLQFLPLIIPWSKWSESHHTVERSYKNNKKRCPRFSEVSQLYVAGSFFKWAKHARHKLWLYCRVLIFELFPIYHISTVLSHDHTTEKIKTS